MGERRRLMERRRERGEGYGGGDAGGLVPDGTGVQRWLLWWERGAGDSSSQVAEMLSSMGWAWEGGFDEGDWMASGKI